MYLLNFILPYFILDNIPKNPTMENFSTLRWLNPPAPPTPAACYYMITITENI